MEPGFGRGAPATPPAAGAGRPMPVLPPKGLLPGRGPAGRPIPVLPPKGLLPGRGPAGRGPAAGADESDAAAGSPTGAGSGSGETAALGAVAAFMAGTTGSAGSADAASAALTSAGASAGAAAFFVVFFAAVFFTGASTAGIASLSLRMTGASTVDEADFTNSPSSCSLARTSLLETPSSLASSWTRTFDTTLLSLARAYRTGPSVQTTHGQIRAFIGCKSS
jgi:hypothetical protein